MCYENKSTLLLSSFFFVGFWILFYLPAYNKYLIEYLQKKERKKKCAFKHNNVIIHFEEF